MSIESQPPRESESLKDLREQVSRAWFALDTNDDRLTELNEVTLEADPEEGIRKIEAYMRDHFDELSERERNYLLLSLRIKNKMLSEI